MPDLTLVPAALAAPAGPVLIVAAGSQEGERVTAAHRHARGQLLGSVRGLLSVGVEDDVWLVPAVHAVWLPPHQLHSMRSHGPFRGWSVYVDEAACGGLPASACTLRPTALLREAVSRAAGWRPGALGVADARLAAVILDEIAALPAEPFGLPLPSDPRLLRIARALIADPADERGLAGWAGWAAIGERTLSRRFVAETGLGFTAWRQRARLLRSLEMLADGLPVASVALESGYATSSAFIRLFRRHLGTTPSAYRRRL